CVHRTLHQLMPVFARVRHERCDDGVLRPALLDLSDFAEVRLNRAVADELDVVETHHARRAEIHGGIARGNVDNGIADGLPNDAAPPSFEGTVTLVSRVGRRAAGDPKGIRRFDTSKID